MALAQVNDIKLYEPPLAVLFRLRFGSIMLITGNDLIQTFAAVPDATDFYRQCQALRQTGTDRPRILRPQESSNADPSAGWWNGTPAEDDARPDPRPRHPPHQQY